MSVSNQAENDCGPTSGLIVVCGLGGLGRACLQTLLRFNVPLRCLDLQPPEWLDRDGNRGGDKSVVLGDMRNPAILRRAGVEEARLRLGCGARA